MTKSERVEFVSINQIIHIHFRDVKRASCGIHYHCIQTCVGLRVQCISILTEGKHENKGKIKIKIFPKTEISYHLNWILQIFMEISI